MSMGNVFHRLIAVAALSAAIAGLSAGRASAQIDIVPQFRVKAGVFLPQNSTLGNAVGNTWLKVGADADVPLGIGFLGSRSRLGVEYAVKGSSTLIPITLTQIWQPSTAVRSPLYFGAGIGLWNGRLKGSGSASRFGFRLVAGADLTEHFFAEAEYDFVDKFGGTRADGLSVMIGTRL